MYTTVEAYLDNGAITPKELHVLPEHALVLLTVLKEENDSNLRAASVSDIVARTAGVMHENIDSSQEIDANKDSGCHHCSDSTASPINSGDQKHG
jgi:hypothetical protein